MEEIVIFSLIFSIPILVILTRFYLKLQEMKLKANGGDSSEVRKEMGHLMAENDELKERISNLEYIINDEKRRIDFDYEKEQILIDQQNKLDNKSL